MSPTRKALAWARREKHGTLSALFSAYRWFRFNVLPFAYRGAIAAGLGGARAHEALASLAQADYLWCITVPDFDREAAERSGERALGSYEAALALAPERLDLYDRYCALLFTMGRVEESMQGFRRWFEAQRALAAKYQLDQLGIRFVDRVVLTSGIGGMAFLDPYVKAGLLGFRPPRQEVLLTPGQPLPNPHFLNYWRRYLTVIDDPTTIARLSPIVPYLEDVLHWGMRIGDDYVPHFAAVAVTHQKWEAEGRPPLLSLTSEDCDRGWATLRRAGVPADAWFVCLHVREAGFKDGGGHHDKFRNCNIDNYLPAIRTITERGGWVIRMGNPTMKPLPPLERAIDYALSDFRSDWMDVFLSAQCRFYVNTSSGPSYVAAAFGVPHVLTNYLPTWSISFQKRDMFIPMLCWHIKDQRPVTFAELMGPPVSTSVLQHHYDQLGLRPVENTPDEINDLITEVLERYDGTVRYSAEDQRLQAQFNELTAKRGTLYGLENTPLNCRIGRGFLRKHAALLPATAGVEEVWSQ